MTYFFHKNREIYFEHQRETTANYIIPFIGDFLKFKEGLQVLEIGCAEGGVLKAFIDKGCFATGVDLSGNRLNIARELMRTELEENQLTLINKDIFEDEFKARFKNQFDLIILKDVIEHINDQRGLISYLHTFLKKDGLIFFSFPPWHMPFGGHQQTCQHKLMAKLPYFHLTPKPLYRLILKSFGENENRINELLRLKRIGMTIERFEKILRKTNYNIIRKEHFLFNPIYKYKFKIKPKKQYRLISKLPFLRNFLTTAVYYLAASTETGN
jgi:SAM-dependent methyltransferase